MRPRVPRRWRCCSAGSGDRAVTLPEARVPGRPLVMGVVNVTPDSFSDGGAWFTAEAAIAHGRELVEQGADLLDVGGESTRPGAVRPSPAEELRRVLPVVAGLSALAPVSIDTMRAEVAAAALDAGASPGQRRQWWARGPRDGSARRRAPRPGGRHALAGPQRRHAGPGPIRRRRRRRAPRAGRARRGAGGGRHPARRHPARPRSGLRQARGPQLGAPAPPRRDRRPRAPARPRRVAQAVPRPGRPDPGDRAPTAGA